MSQKSADTELCQIAKGQAINTCMNMSNGAAGMANCNQAVNVANNACETKNLTIIEILESASKSAEKK